MPQKEQEKEDTAGQAWLGTSEFSEGALPLYLTGNNNWNNENLLSGYQNLYQSNVDSFHYVDNLLVQFATAIGLYFVPGGAVIKIGSSVGSATALFSAGARRQNNLARVRAINAHFKYLKSCGAKMAIKVKYNFKKLAAHFVETCVIALVWLTFAVIKPEPSLSIINIAHNAHIVILVFFMLFLVSSLIRGIIKISRRAPPDE